MALVIVNVGFYWTEVVIWRPYKLIIYIVYNIVTGDEEVGLVTDGFRYQNEIHNVTSSTYRGNNSHCTFAELGPILSQ